MLGRRVSIIVGCAAAVCALAAPSVAGAQVIFLPPGSPAGQEYSVPLDTARQQAAGNQDFNAAPGEDPGPPFGVGVEPESQGSAKSGDGGADDGSETGSGSKASDGGDGGGPRLPELSSSADRGGIDAQVLALAAGAVLLALGTGLGLRRIPGL